MDLSDSYIIQVQTCYCDLMRNDMISSSVYVVPQRKSDTLVPSSVNLPDNFYENCDGELLNIAGKSILDHDKIHPK